MSRSKSLFTYQSLELLNKNVAERIVNLANDAISQHGIFRVALAGGSTPQGLYRVLRGGEYTNKTDWSLWEVYFSDERLVPLTDARSNYAMANEALFKNGYIPKSAIYSVPVQLESVSQVAIEYEAQIRRNFSLNDDVATIPQFDLVLLGLGSDGHTASLFPGKPAVDIVDRLVIESPPGVLPPSVDRVTFTVPLINAAKYVMFLVSGEDKQEAFKAAYSGEVLRGNHLPPAHFIKPSAGKLDWYVTSEVVS